MVFRARRYVSLKSGPRKKRRRLPYNVHTKEEQAAAPHRLLRKFNLNGIPFKTKSFKYIGFSKIELNH